MVKPFVNQMLSYEALKVICPFEITFQFGFIAVFWIAYLLLSVKTYVKSPYSLISIYTMLNVCFLSPDTTSKNTSIL